jgi:hypothetical protein
MSRTLRVTVGSALLVFSVVLVVWGVAVIVTTQDDEFPAVVIAGKEADPEFAGAASFVLAVFATALAVCLLRCGRAVSPVETGDPS